MSKLYPNRPARHNGLDLLRPFDNHNILFVRDDFLPPELQNIFRVYPICINVVYKAWL